MATTAAPRTGTQWNVQSDYTAGFVSPTQYLLDIDVRNQIFDAYQEDLLYDFLIHSGRTKVTKDRTFRWFEHDTIFHIHTVESATGTTGAGNPATITLEEADHLQTGTLSQIKKKDEVLIYTAALGTVKGYVTAKNTSSASNHTVTVQPIDTSIDLVSNIAASDTIGVFSSAASDGAGMTDATSRLPVAYYNYVQIIDTQKVVDGQESAIQARVEINGKPYYYNQMVVDGDLEQRLKFENTAIFGQRGTVTDPDTSKTAYLTGGLEWWADNEGYTEAYSTNFAIGDLDNVTKNLDYERAKGRQMILAGNELDRSLDKMVKGQFDNASGTGGSLDFTGWGMGSAGQRAVDFGIDKFRYNNFEFMKKKFSPFNYQGMTSTSLSKYPGMGFVIGWDKLKASDGSDLFPICLRYMQNDRGSRFNRFWVRDEKITNTDQFEFNHKGEFGIEFGGARQINKIVAS